MKSRQQFYLCKHCGNLVGMINNAGVPLVCCGEPMTELKPNTQDAAHEKHLPVVSREDGGMIRVQVGANPHPMAADHYIEWIYLETAKGGQRKTLQPGDAPEAVFTLDDDVLIAVFAYCNLHSLWKTELPH